MSITSENIRRTMHVLIDNGVEADEVATVMEAIGHALLDMELESLIYDEPVYCVSSFIEDGDEYWSEGCYYEVIGFDGSDTLIRNNFNGVGRIGTEDFDDYFQQGG